MRSCKDDWHDEHYAKQNDRYHEEIQDVENDNTVECYYEMYDRACAAGMTLEEYSTYWMRTLAYYQAQPDE